MGEDGGKQVSADRSNCCENWPKPCSYHEGWEDGEEVTEHRLSLKTTNVATIKTGSLFSCTCDYETTDHNAMDAHLRDAK